MTTLEQDLAAGVLDNGTPPCLSLYQPTSRHHPDNQQDPIRFGNLVKSLEQSLAQQYSRDQAAELLAPFRALADDDEFWRNTFEGLAVLRARDEFHVYRLQRPVAPLAIVADSFHTKPLLRIHQSADRFQILGLSRTSVCLYEGNRDALGAIELADGVPATLADAMGSDHTEMDVDMERYFRAVARAVLQHHSQPSSLPLILAALPEHHQRFRAISHNPHLLPEAIDVHPDALESLDALRQRAWQLLLPQYEARLWALVEEFGTARAHKLGDDVLPQVARAAVAGRVKTLLIEAQRYIPGRLDVQTGRADPTGELHDAHTDDLLDDLGELVISLGGNVVVVPRERMPTTTGVAAIYRFGPTRPDSAAASDAASTVATTDAAAKPQRTTTAAAVAGAATAATTLDEQTLEDHTVVELYAMAKDMQIRGRSNMRKAELIAAIRFGLDVSVTKRQL